MLSHGRISGINIGYESLSGKESLACTGILGASPSVGFANMVVFSRENLTKLLLTEAQMQMMKYGRG